MLMVRSSYFVSFSTSKPIHCMCVKVWYAVGVLSRVCIEHRVQCAKFEHTNT